MRTPVLLALYVLSFLASAAGLRALLGFPEASGLKRKLAHYEADPEGFEVVFVGSSNVLCSVLPDVFREELKLRGHDVRAYNLGVPGMLSFETDHLVRHVLETRPERLRWMFVELTEWRPDPRMSDPTERTVFWHTPERTAAMLETARSYEGLGGRELFDFARDHLELCLWRLGNVGRVQQRLMLLLGAREPDRWTGLMTPAVEGGYLALEEIGHEGAEKGRERFLADMGRYQNQVAELRRQEVPAGPPAAHLVPPAERQLAFFEGTGVEPIHVLFATSHPTPTLLQLGAEEGPLPELWAFNDPRAHPELYKPRSRYDSRHLNRPGAERLTRLLAQRFADHLDRAQGQ
ncbi:MAG: hypothetical protein AAF682_31460 [Planctomycetota bacterium]